MGTEPSGVLNIGLFGGFLRVSAATQARTALLLCRALGAVSCLYLLSLTTPVSEIIGVLRRAHIPALVSDLMYLIYRYLFLLLELYGVLRSAVESRLGFRGLRFSLRSTA
jgi:cobalt/nickel transport system permease protein